MYAITERTKHPEGDILITCSNLVSVTRLVRPSGRIFLTIIKLDKRSASLSRALQVPADSRALPLLYWLGKLVLANRSPCADPEGAGGPDPLRKITKM